jgi:hypothetical protein
MHANYLSWATLRSIGAARARVAGPLGKRSHIIYIGSAHILMAEGVWLRLECHSAHRAPAAEDYGARLAITLWLIPPGTTNTLQALGSALFAIMRGGWRPVCRERAQFDRSMTLNQLTSFECLVPGRQCAGWIVLERVWAPSLDSDDETDKGSNSNTLRSREAWAEHLTDVAGRTECQ